jgi:hypothetical protein
LTFVAETSSTSLSSGTLKVLLEEVGRARVFAPELLIVGFSMVLGFRAT